MTLRDLDRRFVPAAAVVLRRGVDAAEAALTRGRDAVRGAVRAGSRAAVRSGRALDERYADRGPLALLRDVPQLALLLVAVVFASGAVAAAWLAEPSPAPAPTSERTGPAALGVPVGATVDTHLRDAADDVRAAATRDPVDDRLALVSLSRHVGVGALPPLLDGTAAERIYLQAPGVDGAEVIEVPVSGVDAPTVLPALCTATSTRKRQEAQELRNLASTIEATTPEEELQRADFLAEADRAERESAAYAGECVTAFAVVVDGPAAVLADLLDRDGVRGVELAPDGRSVLELQITPLDPATTGSVQGNER